MQTISIPLHLFLRLRSSQAVHSKAHTLCTEVLLLLLLLRCDNNNCKPFIKQIECTTRKERDPLTCGGLSVDDVSVGWTVAGPNRYMLYTRDQYRYMLCIRISMQSHPIPMHPRAYLSLSRSLVLLTFTRRRRPPSTPPLPTTNNENRLGPKVNSREEGKWFT